MSGQLNAPAVKPLGKNTGIHWIRGWMNPIFGLDVSERRKTLTSVGIQNSCRSAYSLGTVPTCYSRSLKKQKKPQQKK
jgi:hypothetical protein